MKRKYRWLFQAEKKKVKATVLAACDTTYLKHAKALLKSLDHFSPGYAMILHVVNPSNLELEELRQLPSTIKNTFLSVSYEINSSILKYSPEETRAYFASARFFFAKYLISKTRKPLICVDADSLFVNPIKGHYAPEGADVALWRRDLENAEVADELKVAATVVVFQPTPGARQFLDRLTDLLDARFDARQARWFVDQLALNQVMNELQATVRVADLNEKYRDCEIFRGRSIIWSGKGERKEFAEPFAALSLVFGESKLGRIQAKHVINRAAIRCPGNKVDRFFKSRASLTASLPKSGTIYLPRLDLPWKPYRSATPPPMSDDTLAVRLRWKAFVTYLANHLERSGISVEVSEIPAWEITAERVNALSGDFAILPHKCRFQIPDLTIPAYFYMQEYLPQLFTLDKEGWGAASSEYPLAKKTLTAQAKTSCYSFYRDQLLSGALATKFAQPPRKPAGEAGLDYDIFFPLQIPHDQVIAFFSDVSEVEVVEKLVDFVRTKGLKLALKPHPANLKSMEPFRALVDNVHVFWETGHIHDLIERSRAVYTLNSSVGFEAMLHDKPIVSFGRTLFDAVTIKGSVAKLGAAWTSCLKQIKANDFVEYRRFYEWFCTHYAVDLNQPELRDARLGSLVKTVIGEVYRETGRD